MYSFSIQKVTLVTAISLALLNSGCGQIHQVKTESVNTSSKLLSNNLELSRWPKLTIEVKKDPAIEAKVSALLKTMTLEQKVAQMIQPEIRDISIDDMRRYGFGSYLNGGGSFPNGNKHASVQEWINLAEQMYQASIDDSQDGIAIPTMWGTDAVHGHNNVIGATLFPHNIGLGAMRDPQLIEQIAHATAQEVMVTGIDWIFAPTVAVVRDDRWGRTYEGYSEHPDIVKQYSYAIVKGLQGQPNQDLFSDNHVLSTVKHFLGDGGTVNGDDQGNNIADEQTLVNIHAQGYVGGLTAGAQSVMASFNSWHGKKNHGNHYLLTQVLKQRMGFDGFVVGDWNGHGQVQGCSNESCPQAVNAGLDMFMAPTKSWKALYNNTIAQVKSGVISQARIDDAVTRILRVKFRLGLFDKPSPAKRLLSGKTELLGSSKHREIARQAVRESLVLLKNNKHLLPLSPTSNILVAGDGADNIGKQAGGWTITWQGTGNNNDDFPGATSIYQGIKQQVTQAGGRVSLSVNGEYQQKPDVAIVVFGEDPYAEGHGDRENVDYQLGNKKDLQLLKKLKADGIPVVSIFLSGRPLWVNAELNASDAFVAAWLPGSEGQGIADVILADKSGKVQYDFSGKLSFSWPNSPLQTAVNYQDADYQPLFAYGYGLTYQDNTSITDDLIETYVIDQKQLKARVLFNGQIQQPWLMWLTSDEQQQQITSNKLELNNISYRTIDKKLQEDAFYLYSSGEQQAGIALISKSNFREDLRSEAINHSALVFDIKVDALPNSPLNIAMQCAGEHCGAALNITPNLTKLPTNSWQQLAIDVQCFVKQGMQMENLVSPFALSSKGSYSLALANIRFEPNYQAADMIRCNAD